MLIGRRGWSPPSVLLILAVVSCTGGPSSPSEFTVGSLPQAISCSDLAATMNDLRQISAPSGCVILQGFYAANDGGGGTFCWDSASTIAEDKGTIVAKLSTSSLSCGNQWQAGSGSGRWLRQYSGPVNVK